MSKFKVGDKVKHDGSEPTIKGFGEIGGERVVLLHTMAWAKESGLTPAAPPKLGKCVVRLRERGTIEARRSVSDFCEPVDGTRDIPIDLDAIDADKRRADAAERRAQQYAADLGAANKRIAELEAMSFNQRAELDRLRAAPADLVSLDELDRKGCLIRKVDGEWRVRIGNVITVDRYSTHAAAWKAASEWAKQQPK